MGGPSYDFSGRHVLVTGGSRGLGYLLARTFSRHGARVTITGTQSLTSYYDADLTGFDYRQLDLTDGESIAELAERVGHLDVLVNNAAPRLPFGVDAGEREFIAQAARIGLVGPLQLGTRLRLDLATSTLRGGGAVVNMPSIKRWFDLTHGSEVAELEVDRFTQRVGTAWARLGIRVNSVTAPEMVPTQRSGLSVRIEQGSAPLMTRTQVPGAVTQREIVDVALFLASDGAAGLAGQTLLVGATTPTAPTLF
ncbi:MAG: SDR family oxidoreductase [Nocardioidaceae bacterium]|nr:SDR family oxidoreductase [Nocardioidaceae bacterium]